MLSKPLNFSGWCDSGQEERKIVVWFHDLFLFLYSFILKSVVRHVSFHLCYGEQKKQKKYQELHSFQIFIELHNYLNI